MAMEQHCSCLRECCEGTPPSGPPLLACCLLLASQLLLAHHDAENRDELNQMYSKSIIIYTSSKVLEMDKEMENILLGEKYELGVGQI